jgi:hypothetical protein
MKRLYAQQLIAIGSACQAITQLAESRAQSRRIDAQDLSDLHDNIDEMRMELQYLGLDLALAQLGRISGLLQFPDKPTNREIGVAFTDLEIRIHDEVARHLCFMVPVDRAKLYTESSLFGADVTERFPSAIIDIEEAGKCLAMQRGTAAVFHLMRVMEVGLKATAGALGIPYAPSWESYLRQIKASMDDDWKKKPVKWRKSEPFFRDVHAHLYAVKSAWRNPTMHIVSSYTPEMAEEVFNAVKGLMRHLATKLREEQPKRGRKSR